jgi:uncharacterized DUF497 family protein
MPEARGLDCHHRNLFRSPIAVFPDPEHSAREERFKAIGRTEDGRGVLIVFTLRVRATRR